MQKDLSIIYFILYIILYYIYIIYYILYYESLIKLIVFASASHQTELDTRSMTWRPTKVRIKGMGKSGTSRDSNSAGLCSTSTDLVQCESNESSCFFDPNLGPGTDAEL